MQNAIFCYRHILQNYYHVPCAATLVHLIQSNCYKHSLKIGSLTVKTYNLTLANYLNKFKRPTSHAFNLSFGICMFYLCFTFFYCFLYVYFLFYSIKL